MNGPAVITALAAAGCFGASTSMQHYTADPAGPPGGSLPLMARLARQPWWWVGLAVSVVGLGLHVGALHLGPLLLVQPLLVTGVVFALLIRAALGRHRPPWRAVGWAGLIAAALAAFLVAAGPAPAHRAANTGAAMLAVLGGCVVAALAAGGASMAARRSSRSAAGALLGAAAGVLFGLVAGLLKMLTAASGISTVLRSWPLYALIAVGGWALVLNQRGYQMAPLHWSLPTLNVIDPLSAIVFGAIVLGEHPARGPAALTIETAAGVAMLVGLVGLYRGEEPEQRRGPPAPGRATLTDRQGQR